MNRSTTPMAVALVALLIGFAGPPPAFAQPPCDEIDPLLVLPGDEVCPGWMRDGEARTAYTLQELADIINGAAFLYGQYGFVAAAVQNYAGEVGSEPTWITLSAFNQSAAAMAEAFYNHPNSGSGDPVEDWDGTGHARMGIALGTVSFQFWEACFFVSIVVVTGGEEAVPHARCFADEVVDRIQDPTSVAPQTWGDLRVIFR